MTWVQIWIVDWSTAHNFMVFDSLNWFVDPIGVCIWVGQVGHCRSDGVHWCPLGVCCQGSVRSLIHSNQIWRADLDSSPNWDLMPSSNKFLRYFFGVCQESVWSLLGIFWESDSNQIWRADLYSSPNLESWFGQLSKLRPCVFANKFLRVCCWV